MFRRLREVFSKSAETPLEFEAVRDHLGTQYAVEIQNLVDHRYDNDEKLGKRAAGVLALGRAIVLTRGEFADDERHHFFWSEIAKPMIDARFSQSSGSGYDPAKFFVDAQDYAAVAIVLPRILEEADTPLAQRFINIMRWLNSRESENGGYFGNSPYWSLHDNQVWRPINKEFSSVQVYWFNLLVADQAASDFAINWTHAIVSEKIKGIVDLSKEAGDKLVANYIPKLGQILSLGCLNLVANADSSDSRFKAFYEITEGLAPDSRFVIEAVMNEDLISPVRFIKAITPQIEALQLLPDDSSSLNFSTKIVLKRFLSLMEITQMTLKLSRGQVLIKDPEKTVPHLLYASK